MPDNLNSWPDSTICAYYPWRALVVLGWLVFAPVVIAGAATPYGEDFVRVGQSWPDGGSVANWSSKPVVQDLDSASYQRHLEQLEQQGGPYADTLAEPLADMARMHIQQGDIERALGAYQRALHVVRINEGLYSEQQVPILRELFELYRMSGDLATLDARYDYFFRLYGSGRAPYDGVRLGAALEYLRWQREAIRLGLDSDETGRLLAVYSLNEDILTDVSADPAVDLATYRALVYSQLRNLYLLEDRYEPEQESESIVAASRMPAAWGEEYDVQQHKLEVLQRRALGIGRNLLQGLIARTPPEQLEELAAAYLELADWNQWNDRSSDAIAAYSEVVKLLQASARTELLERWLGQPTELPANGAFWQPRQLAQDEDSVVIQARYDVSASGRAKNIETTTTLDENARKASRVKRELAQTRFRPRIVNGEPEPELQLQRDYEVLN